MKWWLFFCSEHSCTGWNMPGSIRLSGLDAGGKLPLLQATFRPIQAVHKKVPGAPCKLPVSPSFLSRLAHKTSRGYLAKSNVELFCWRKWAFSPWMFFRPEKKALGGYILMLSGWAARLRDQTRRRRIRLRSLFAFLHPQKIRFLLFSTHGSTPRALIFHIHQNFRPLFSLDETGNLRE